MNDKFSTKLRVLNERYHELEALLSLPDTINDQKKFREYSVEYHSLQEVVAVSMQLEKIQADIVANKQMLLEQDQELVALAEAELIESEQLLIALTQQLKILLLPSDPDDNCNVFLEIRAGTGGDEAAIFVGDLFRMYAKFAETQKWQIEIMSSHPSEQGGYKEIICKIIGDNVYAKLKFESGAHRVQRVPATESQGRVHTSACTVAILQEVEHIENININTDDLKIDTFRASGAGGQHVNKTDSAIRITHIPTGVVVECQDDRSQHKNKAKALALLHARLLKSQQDQQKQEQDDERKKLVGSGDRSDRIRTYNYPQGRLTDHRINLTLYKLDIIMEGNLQLVIDPILQEHQLEQLAAMGME